MVKTIIDTALTETYFAESNDEIIVRQSGSVITDDILGISKLTYSETNVSVRVLGTIEAAVVGIDLYTKEGADGGVPSNIRIGETGRVIADLGLQTWQDSGADVLIAGTVHGGFGAVEMYSPDSTLRISGTVSAELSTVRINSRVPSDPDGFCDVFNSGTIRSESHAAVSIWYAGAELRNIGTVSGATGIHALGFQTLTINNNGLVVATLGAGIELYDGGGLAKISNSGVVDSKTNAFYMLNSDARLANSGTMSGETGLRIESLSTLELRNSGVITGETEAIWDYGFGLRDIVNHGLIAGDLEASKASSDYHLVNHGTFAGDIRFGYADDVYKLAQTGTMTGTVHGGLGNDTLIGNDSADQLSGAEDDDRLDGRGGDDVLDGGQGDDRLQGGTGADVFVFGAQSGRDRVTDFDDGSDILRLVGHAGGFDGLTISDRNGNLLVEHDNGVIVLVGEAGLALTAADFDFVIV